MFKPWEMKYDTANDGSGSAGGVGGAAPMGDGAPVSGGTGATAGDGGSAIASTGGVPASWLESLPEDIRKDPSIQLFKDTGPAGLAKSWVHAQKTMGKDKIVLPGEGATDAEWETIYQKLGRPEAPDKYELKLPEGAALDKEFAENFKKTAFEAGLSAKQLNKLAEWYHGSAAGAIMADQAQRENERKDAITSYKEKLGGDEKYQAQVQRAQIATRALLNDEQKAFIKEVGADTHPAMVDLFANLAGMMSEDKIRDGTGVAHGESLDTIQKEIEAVESKLFSDLNNPNKDVWMAQREKLYTRKMQAMGAQ